GGKSTHSGIDRSLFVAAEVRDGGCLLESGDFDELLRNQRSFESRGLGALVPAESAGLERAQHVLDGERVADVEHVRPGGSNGQRPIPNLLEIAAPPQIERERDDGDAVALGEPRDGGRSVEIAGKRENDAIHMTVAMLSRGELLQ